MIIFVIMKSKLTTKKKQKIILACVLLLAGIAVFVSKEQMAQGWIRLAKHIIRQNSHVRFGFEPIDSLYEKNHYRYFLFVKGKGYEGKAQPPFQTTNRDSLLIISDDMETRSAEGLHHIFAPASVFDFLLKPDEGNALFRITDVTKRTDAGNLYQLERI